MGRTTAGWLWVLCSKTMGKARSIPQCSHCLEDDPHNCAWLRLLLLDRQTVLVLTILLPRWPKRHNLHLHSAQSSWQGCRPPSATWHTRPSCTVPNQEPWLQTTLYSLVRWKINYQACVQEAHDRTLRPAPLHLLY